MIDKTNKKNKVQSGAISAHDGLQGSVFNFSSHTGLYLADKGIFHVHQGPNLRKENPNRHHLSHRVGNLRKKVGYLQALSEGTRTD